MLSFSFVLEQTSCVGQGMTCAAAPPSFACIGNDLS